MKNQALILQQTSAFVKKDFEVESMPEDVTEDELIDFLERFVLDLIDRNLEKLFWALYRLDINEQKVHRALMPTAKEPPHKVIAKLIFDREMQKAKTRIEYAQKESEADDDVQTW